ncbi:non-ribosomal peptide synthetase, partial [Niastella populi]|uniref:non-ribosomal peptide synthetase n=1 Tax=Niastella populi TaxID=550983 RepID=UPI001055E3D3
MPTLNLIQQEIYFDQIIDSRNPHYNIGTYIVIEGDLHVDLFKDSIKSSKNVFDVFKYKSFSNYAPFVNLQESDVSIQITEVDFTSDLWSRGSVKKWLQERINTPFDIYGGSLYDFVLIKISDAEYWFYMGCHHLFSDGYGVPYVYLAYIFDKYHALRTGEKKEFNYPSYLELIEKSTDYLNSKSYESDKEYWKQRFAWSQEPIIQKRAKAISFRTDSFQIFFSADEQQQLRSFCANHDIGLQDFLIAVLAVYYYKTNNQEYFDFSLPIHNRTSRLERMTLGLFSKFIPCRLKLGSRSLKELFDDIKTNQRQDYRHKQFPVSHFNAMLLSEAGNVSRPFDISVNYRYFKLNTNESELHLKGFKNDAAYSRTPIEFSFCDFTEKDKDDLFLEIIFREDYFTNTEVRTTGKRLLKIIDQFYVSVNDDIDSIDVLDEQEKHELLVTFNDTAGAYPKDKTIVDLFEEQVAKTPDHIAVVFEDTNLSYRELNERSDQLAHYLRENYDIVPDDLIGIRQTRSEWMMVSILGALKSGGAYVPIDPEYPRERIDYIEADTKCKVCLDETELNKFRESQERYSKEPVSSTATSNNLAYVIYTSGSTGKPKGVMIEHRNVTNFFSGMTSIFGEEKGTFLAMTNYTFDISVLELLWTLSKGYKVVIQGEARQIGEDQNNYSVFSQVRKHKVTHLQITPSMGSMLNQHLSEEEGWRSIKNILLGGEPCTASLVNDIYQKLPDAKLYNMYGPTETTIWSTVKPLEKNTQKIEIGKPIANTQIYVLSEKEELQPVGVAGEICIGGEGLARGYLNKEALTREKFIASPFKEGERLYKTGDLGRWLADGNIELVGRKDDQVKIRGYRIELGEIEHALLNREEISQAVVIARENELGEKELVAYLTSNAAQNTSDLKAYLEKSLPAYMLPACFVQLEAIPLTANGKVDRKSLPDPEGLALTSGLEYVAPRTELERKLVKIWEEVLEREHIGVNDDFFTLGGHSLKAVRLGNEYQKELSARLGLKELFAHTSVASHALLIASSTREAFFQIEKVTPQESYPVSDGQKRVWVLSQFEGGSVAHNMFGSIYLNDDIDIEKFKLAIDATIDRHEILRTVFREDEAGEIRQWIMERKDIGFGVGYKDFRKETERKEKAEAWIAADGYRAFDLAKGPLLRAVLLQVEEDEYVFYLNIHHIISDGWSMEVLAKDVFRYYEAYKAGKAPALNELRIQYKDYSAWQLGQLNQESFKAHREYWLDKFSGELPLLDLPGIKQRPKIKTYNARCLATYVDKGTTAKLKGYVQANGGSLFMGLLASWNVLMYRYTSGKDIIIGTQVAGRNHTDLEDQIGNYVNTLGLRNEVNPEESFAHHYQVVKENTLKSYSHQVYPFDRLVEELGLQRDTSRSTVFDISITYNNISENKDIGTIDDDIINQVSDNGPSKAKNDIELHFGEVGDYIYFKSIYNEDVYEREMIKRLMEHFKRLLSSVLSRPGEKVSKVEYLSAQERQELLITFNDTAVAYPKDKTIVDLFEEQVAKTPGNIALVFEDIALSYRELNERSNQLAHYLKANYAIGPDDL